MINDPETRQERVETLSQELMEAVVKAELDTATTLGIFELLKALIIKEAS